MSVTRLAWPAATLAVAAAVLLSLAVGTRPVPPSAVLDALLHGGSSPDALVVRSLRLPRTEIGLTAGAALGVAGAALQAVTRNPLADPGILGLSQGAAAGVVLAIATGLASGFSGYVWYAFAGAVLAACLVYGIAARGRGRGLTGQTRPRRYGVVGDDRRWYDRRPDVEFGDAGPVPVLAGRLAERPRRGHGRGDAAVPGGRGAAGARLCAGAGRAGPRGRDRAGARASGGVVRVCAALGATLLVASAVAAAGPIAFVGLAVPHLARRLTSGGHRSLLPLSALLGAALLVGADVAGRVVRSPAEVPAGVMTALVGVPVLVVLVRRKATAV